MPTRYELDRDGLASLLDGEPRYRVDQIWHGLYEQGRSLEELSSVPKALRLRLASELPPALTPVAESVTDGGTTVKWLWSLPGGAAIETVLMHYSDRSTVCVSTQAGCAMACGFCATGQAGFQRQLTTGEIIEQIMMARRHCAPRRVSNVVFMGMGEPLANYDAMWCALQRLHDDSGISSRHITVSTVGLVPGIKRLASEALPVNLAISLHAANDELRDLLVPVNKLYPLANLTVACEEYLAAKRRRLSFEWALIDGVNDRPGDAAELAEMATPLRAHVNLIPLNPTPGYPARGTPPERVAAFRDLLGHLGVNATVRQNRGTSIDAACGQLRGTHAAGKLR